SSFETERAWFANPVRYRARYSQSPLRSPVNTRPVRLPPCAAGASPTTRRRSWTSQKPGTGRPQYSHSRQAARFCRAIASRWRNRRAHFRQAMIVEVNLSIESGSIDAAELHSIQKRLMVPMENARYDRPPVDLRHSRMILDCKGFYADDPRPSRSMVARLIGWYHGLFHLAQVTIHERWVKRFRLIAFLAASLIATELVLRSARG